MPLTEKEIEQFEETGCVALVNYLDKATVKTLNNEIEKILSNVNIHNHPKIKFTTGNDKEGHISDKYFMDSADKLHYFFEPESIDGKKLNVPLNKAINKIGHGLHFLNEAFESVTVNDDIASMCRQLRFKEPKAVQSMCVIKQPHIGAEVPPHNDAEFLYTEPSSCIGFWFALQDCTLENGCLQFIPGSHKNKLMKRFVKDLEKGSGTKFADINDLSKEFVPTPEQEKLLESYKDDANYESLVIPAGTLVLIHGNLIHKSPKNVSDQSRNAYTFHVVEGNNVYDEYNWLQIPPNKPAGSANFTRLYRNYE